MIGVKNMNMKLLRSSADFNLAISQNIIIDIIEFLKLSVKIFAITVKYS